MFDVLAIDGQMRCFSNFDGPVSVNVSCFSVLKTSGNTSNLLCHLDSKQPNVVKTPIGACGDYTDNAETNEIQPIKSHNVQPSTSCTQQTLVTTEGQSQQKYMTYSKRIKQFKDGGTLSEKITQGLVYMICKDSEPLYLVEHDGFRHLMRRTHCSSV